VSGGVENSSTNRRSRIPCVVVKYVSTRWRRKKCGVVVV